MPYGCLKAKGLLRGRRGGLWLQAKYPVPQSEDHGIQLRVHLELQQDPVHVGPHGLRADVEVGTDLAGGAALGEGLKDLDPGSKTKMDNTITVPADPNNPVGGLNIVVDQRTKIFDTLFYGGPADESFSALPDE